jgi:PAS domain-containing protein
MWRKDRSSFRADYSARLLGCQSDGTKCVITLQDVTEREKSAEVLRNSEECMRRNEEKFRRILTNLPDSAWTTDQNGHMVYISPRIEELTGYGPRDLYAQGLKLLLGRTHPEDLGTFQSAVEDLFCCRKPLDIEF